MAVVYPLALYTRSFQSIVQWTLTSGQILNSEKLLPDGKQIILSQLRLVGFRLVRVDCRKLALLMWYNFEVFWFYYRFWLVNWPESGAESERQFFQEGRAKLFAKQRPMADW